MAWVGIAQAGMQATEKIIGGIQQYQASKTNAKINNANADQVLLDAAEQARRQREQAVRLAGGARAAAAAQGIAYDGSAVEGSVDLQAQMELDALDTLWQGRREAERYRFQAKAAKAEGKAALGGAILGAGGKAAVGLERFYAMREREKGRTGGLNNSYAAELS